MSEHETYPLGADDSEIERLALQYRVWRDIIMQCWRDAGISAGKRVLDLGAGPGHATVDLAQIVGASGQVAAVEREPHFVSALQETIRAKSFENVAVHSLDLATDDLPPGQFDFAWSRLLVGFISDRAGFIRKIARALGRNGVVIFHEFAQYNTWRLLPPVPMQERFVQYVITADQRIGGTAGAVVELPPLLIENGFVIRSAIPRIFCVRPNEPMWEWPVSFVGMTPGAQRRSPMEQQFLHQLRADLARAKANPNTLMITPLVLELVAEKL